MYGALAAGACARGEVGCSFRLLRFATVHLPGMAAEHGGGAGATARTVARRLLCLCADAHKKAATAVTAANLHDHTQVGKPGVAPPRGMARTPAGKTQQLYPPPSLRTRLFPRLSGVQSWLLVWFETTR